MYYISIEKIHNTVRKYNDLYVEIKYNNSLRRTTTIWNKTLPVWNEKFFFDLDENVDYFTITIYEKNVWTSTQKLYENNVKINRCKVQTFKYKYLEISHGIPFNNIIYNLRTENNIIKKSNENLKNINKTLIDNIDKFQNKNNNLIEENQYLNKKLETFKNKLIIEDNKNNILKKTIDTLNNKLDKIKSILN